MKFPEKAKEKAIELLLNSGQIVFAGAVASEVFKTADGKVNAILAMGVSAVLVVLGFVVIFITSDKGDKNG